MNKREVIQSRQFYTYAHRRNDTGEIFYVGKGIGQRAWVKKRKNKWWQNIADKHGFTVEIISFHYDEEFAFNAEVFFTRDLLERGCTLVNQTEGGGGTVGYRHTAESKKLMGERVKAAYQDEEVKKRVFEARNEACRTPEYREKQSELKTQWFKENSHPRQGVKLSDDTKTKISVNNGSRRPEVAAKISASKQGELNPNFGKDGHKTSAFKGCTVGTASDGTIVIFTGGKDMQARGMNHSAIYQCIAGNKPQYKGFTFTRTTDENYLRQLLEQDNFFDEQSKTILQNFLQ